MMINEVVPIRSAMSLFSNPVKRGKLWSRQDAIKSVRLQSQRSEITYSARVRFSTSTKRVALVKETKTHFHVVGLGKVKATSFDSLKKVLRGAGFTHFRKRNGKSVYSL
jgi:hypothetical protein